MFSANSSQVSDSKLFVEDVFSTYLYTGTGSAITVTNGIDLAGKGGLIWTKARSAANRHALVDTAMGGGFERDSASTAIDRNLAPANAFNATGYTINDSATSINSNGVTYASWTFREAPKFFDVVTYTGNGTAGRTIAHNLGIAPGMILVKRTDTSGDWRVYHRSRPNEYASLASTDAFYTASANRVFGDGTTVVAPTSTEFTVGDIATINGSGGTYVAYLFAHDATSDGLIQCGSYTAGGSPVVTLGWEPQWLMIKNATTGDVYQDWYMFDNMRKLDVSNSGNAPLRANTSGAEGGTYATSGYNLVQPRATGFVIDPSAQGASGVNNGSDTYIYIAIRRGPMKTPTLGTSVFAPWTRTGTGTTTIVSSTTFPPDLLITKQRTASEGGTWFDSLRGRAKSLLSSGTGAELTTTTTTNDLISFNMNGITVGANAEAAVNGNGLSIVDWNFRRAPGFFDVVCYTGTGVARTVNHNLGVAPELMITKKRNGNNSWPTYLSMGASSYLRGLLNGTDTPSSNTYSDGFGLSSAPTSTVINVDSGGAMNASGDTYVAYLFASCPGVSKVGSYTGNGSSQTINCGFAAGARFIMIKRTDSTGNWCVWDTARGIVSGDDPVLSLNNTLAESNTTDDVDAASTGFIVNSVSPGREINLNGSTYIYLAIA